MPATRDRASDLHPEPKASSAQVEVAAAHLPISSLCSRYLRCPALATRRNSMHLSAHTFLSCFPLSIFAFLFLLTDVRFPAEGEGFPWKFHPSFHQKKTCSPAKFPNSNK